MRYFQIFWDMVRFSKVICDLQHEFLLSGIHIISFDDLSRKDPRPFELATRKRGCDARFICLQTFAAFFFLNQIHFCLLRPNKICVFFSLCEGILIFSKQILWVPPRVTMQSGQIASRPSPNGGSGSGKCSKPETFRFFGITFENLPNGIRSFDDRNIKNGTC